MNLVPESPENKTLRSWKVPEFTYASN